ncbi:hypothetical protein D3C87_2130080 [compost metagenome]
MSYQGAQEYLYRIGVHVRRDRDVSYQPERVQVWEGEPVSGNAYGFALYQREGDDSVYVYPLQ